MIPRGIRDIHGNWLGAGLLVLVPVLSLGGLLLAVVLQGAGLIGDAADFFWGSVLGSFVLAIVALQKPRKDIVSLCAPIFAIFVFVVPLETKPSLLLQALYAASLTALSARLHLRFSTPGPADREEITMEKYLYDYIDRIGPFFSWVQKDCAHDIASTVLSFKFGLYTKAASDAARAIAKLGKADNSGVLSRALSIVRDRAEALGQSKPGEFSPVTFEADDHPFLALHVSPENIEAPQIYDLDNALLLLYAVAYLRSPDDGQSLDEHQNFVIQILEGYKKLISPG
ncbi:MAG: hypothetical protein QFX32_01440 [Methanolinea sp.]|nr:hypothetical protein [Methanolinea sp.]